MLDPSHSAPNEPTYIINAESAAETARLMYQDRLLTKSMGGIFSEERDFSGATSILDLACGPGGWVIDVAFAYPHIEVVGIDISETTIQYARTQARTQGVDNAHFLVMNALEPLAFADHSFDVVNARLLFPFMPKEYWPHLLRECFRLLRPGGTMRLTESEAHITNSPAFERLVGQYPQAFERVQRSFSPGGRNFGITAMLRYFLRNVGCTSIAEQAHVVNFSMGTELHASMYQNLMVSIKLSQPFLVQAQVMSEEEFEPLYQRVLVEMQSKQFCGVWYLLSAWGEKPAALHQAIDPPSTTTV